MTREELINKVRELKELQSLIEEATAEADSIKDELKNEMAEQKAEELTVDVYKLRYTTVSSNRFDSSAFKQTHADLYKQYVKETVSKRFSVA